LLLLFGYWKLERHVTVPAKTSDHAITADKSFADCPLRHHHPRIGLFVELQGVQVSSLLAGSCFSFLPIVVFGIMFRHGIRRLATAASQATIARAEAQNSYGLRVSKAQGVVKGLTGGTQEAQAFSINHHPF
jgi:cysteine synthase A